MGFSAGDQRTGARMENLQLRVEDAGIGFDNGDGTVEGRKREEGVLRANNGGQVQSEILWVHVGGEAEGQALLLSRGDFDGILVGCQVANDARRRSWIGGPQTATNELNGDWIGLFIGEGEDGLGLLAIDQLNAEDFSIGEAGFNCDGNCRRLCWVFDHFCDLL